MKRLFLFLLITMSLCRYVPMSLFAFTYPDSTRGIPDFVLSGYQRGLGDAVSSVGARSVAMGSTGITSSDEPSTIFINPAGLSTIDSKMFSFGFSVIPVSERIDTTSKDAPFYNSQMYYSLDNIALAYPFSESFQAGLGFFPLYDFQYKHKKYYYSGGKTTGVKNISATGTIYTLTPAISFKWRSAALGVAYNSWLGKGETEIKDTTYATSTTAQVSTKTVLTSEIPGSNIALGSVVHIGQNVRLGLAYKTSFKADNKYKTMGSTITVTGKAEYSYPSEIGFGLGYFFGSSGENKILIDFLMKNWADFRVSGKKLTGFRNFNELHIGAEHKITQDVLLRYGFYYQPYYAAREFEKVFFTAGVGVNLSTVLSVDIAGEYGKRDYRFIDEQERFWDDDQRVDESIKKILLQGKLKW